MSACYIITGGSGALGRKLIEVIKENDPKAKIIALTSQQALAKQDDYLLNEDFFGLENLDYKKITLYHLAFARKSTAEDISSSLDFFYRVVEKAEDLKVSKFINVSSQSVYDPKRRKKASESDTPRPSRLYGIAKLYSEYWLNDKKGQAHDWYSVRLGSLIGREYSNRITSRLLRKSFEDEEIEIDDNGSVFSYLHIVDAAEGLYFLSTLSESMKFNHINLATDESYSISEMMDTILSITRKYRDKLPRVKINDKLEGRSNNSVNTEVLADLGWTARISLKDALVEEVKREHYDE